MRTFNRIIIFSGAGISEPSGIPAYDDLLKDPDFNAFMLADEKSAISLVKPLANRLATLSPNAAHREVSLLGKLCSALGLHFVHFTSNVDNLLEKVGQTPTHIFGSINNPQSVVKGRFEALHDFSHFKFLKNDLVLFLGVSKRGAPIYMIEAEALAASSEILHYDLHKDECRQSELIEGNIRDNFVCIDLVARYLPNIDFIELKEQIAQVGQLASVKILEREYEVYFTLTRQVGGYSEEDFQAISGLIGGPLDDQTYEVKFDLKENRERSNSFSEPVDNYSPSEMRILGLSLATVIATHSKLFNAQTYTASVDGESKEKLSIFYERLANRYCSRLNFEHKSIETIEGTTHVFKKAS